MAGTKLDSPQVRQRDLNLDLIRCVAVFSVIARHFFLNTGYDDRILAGGVMHAMTFLRTGTMVCVPLFVMLTGYLCNKKQLTARYFMGLVPTLLTYVLCAVFTLMWRKYVWGEEVSLLWGISQILQIDQGAIWYGWYVEMYIGLYLLIPFLNLIYNGLETKKKKQLLITVLLFMTMLPISVNVYDLSTPGFWQNPSISETYHVLLPKWWTGIWPLTYYFIGAYIREYQVRLPKFWGPGLLLGCLTVFSVYNIYRSQGTSLFRPNLDNWGGFQNTADSILVFLLILGMDLSRVPRGIRWVLSRVAVISFAIYLCSYVSDVEVYGRFKAFQFGLDSQILWYPLVVLASVSLAGIPAQLITWAQQFLIKMAKRFLDPPVKKIWERIGP